MMHRMRQVWRAVLPVDNSGRVYVVGSVPVLHPEAQTVDEMLEGWRNQQLCRNLDPDTIAGAPRGTLHRAHQ
jgi:integrase/recombinase XerD